MKNVTKIILIVMLLLFAGGVGGAFFGDYLRSALQSCKLFSKCSLLHGQKENITVINNTEKVIIEEDHNINEISAGAKLSIVDILSFEKKDSTRGLKNSQSEVKMGIGTILTNDGLVVTNRNNIIEEDAKYEVTIFDGSTLVAVLVLVDKFTNLAYLRIESTNLPAIPFANVSDINTGKKIIAVGKKNLNSSISLAEGVVSDLDENFNLAGNAVFSSDKISSVLLTDIKINNDAFNGGVIINYSGEMVAIGLSSGDTYYQIPARFVKEAMKNISSQDFSPRAELGIYYISVNKFTAKKYNLESTYGALIYSDAGKQGLAIIKGSVAEKAGLKLNDIILEIDNKKISQENPLSELVSKYKKGDEVKMKIMRDKDKLEINIEF